MKICDTISIQTCDQMMLSQCGYPSFSLMENAARAFTQTFLNTYRLNADKDNILILCGTGNNGGDGLAIARTLFVLGYKVEIAILKQPENAESDPGKMFALLQLCDIKIQYKLPALSDFSYLIDGLYGTGVSGELRGLGKEWIESCQKTKSTIVAIDLPSGLIAGSGKIYTEPLKADSTITFHLPKFCHYVYPAAEYCGKILHCEIGILPSVTNSVYIRGELADAAFFQKYFRPRNKNSHKGESGHALICGGSKGMSGAVSLSALGAFKAGAGKVSVFVPEGIRKDLHKTIQEIMSFNTGSEKDKFLISENVNAWSEAQSKVQACAIGPGMGTHIETCVFLLNILKSARIPLIIDADALNILANEKEYWKLLPENTILTPHPGEMSRLSGINNIQEQRLEIAETWALKTQCVIVLKGAGTIIASPDGKTFICPYGNSILSVAGSGDILTGLITAFRASGYSANIAAALGVIVHAKAADILTENIAGKKGLDNAVFLESGKLLDFIPIAIQNLLESV